MKTKSTIKTVLSAFIITFAVLAFQSCSDTKKPEVKTIEKTDAKADTKAMKCEPGKCGDAMKADKTEKDTKTATDSTKTMKCEAGKCGDAMKADKTEKATK